MKVENKKIEKLSVVCLLATLALSSTSFASSTVSDEEITRELYGAFGKTNTNDVEVKSIPMGQTQTIHGLSSGIKKASPVPVITETKVTPVGTKRTSILGVKIIPSVGFENFDADASLDYSAKVNANLKIEKDLADHFSFGVGVRYSSFTVDDDNTNSALALLSNFALLNGSGIAGRDMNYSNIAFEAYSKVFITGVDSKIRPYIGGGVGYSTGTLKFSENTTNINIGNGNGSEEYSSGFATGTLMAGAEVSFSKNFGAVLNLKYRKALGQQEIPASSINTGADQQALNVYGSTLDNSIVIGGTLGILLKF